MSASNSNPDQKSAEKSLQKENKALRTEIKQLELKIKTVQSDLNKSTSLKDRLEGLCRELQKQNRFIKAESSAKIAEANAKGKELAQEVQNNMGFMKNINQNLASITSESLEVKRENEDLAKKIATLKDHYEEREKILQSALNETNALLLITKQELGELKLKNAEEKEKLYGEMQQLANALVQSREQMKEAKETEITLRNLIQNYDDKFNGLQKALKDTNGAYDEFKQEMGKVTGRTKDLEKETSKWQSRWEESHTALISMEKNHLRLQGELIKAQENLTKMTSLCRVLQIERKELLKELKTEEDKKPGGAKTSKEDEARNTALDDAVKALTSEPDSTENVTSKPEEVKQAETVETPAVLKLNPEADLESSDSNSTVTPATCQDNKQQSLDSEKTSVNHKSTDEKENSIKTECKGNKNTSGASNNNSSKTSPKKKSHKNKNTPNVPTKDEKQSSPGKTTSPPGSPIIASQPEQSDIKGTDGTDKAAAKITMEETTALVNEVDGASNNSAAISEAKEKPKPACENKDSKDESKPVCENNDTNDESKPASESKDTKDESKPVCESKDTNGEELSKSQAVPADLPEEKSTKPDPQLDKVKVDAPNISIPKPNTPPSQKTGSNDTPKSNKKGQPASKPHTGDDSAPKPNKKSKKHK